MKRVLIISYEFPPIIGGAGVYAYDLATGLKLNGCDVTVLTYRHKNGFDKIVERLNEQGIKVRTIPNLRWVHFFLFFILLKICVSQHSYDLVVFNDGRSKRIGALFQNSLKKAIKNSVSIFHGNEQYAMFDSPSRLQKIVRLKEKLISFLKKQINVVVVSKREYEVWSNTEIGNKLKLINHGVDISLFYPRDRDQINRIRGRYGIDPGTDIILSASRLVKEKGQIVLLECLPDILRERPNTLLLIAGSGPYEANLKKMVEQLSLNDHVRFLGGLRRETLSELYSICEIFILPSQFYESFGLVYLEAAACKRLSIAGNRGGTSDAIIDGETGYLVDPFDKRAIIEKVCFILKDESLRNKFKLAAYDRVIKEFNNISMARNLINIIV